MAANVLIILDDDSGFLVDSQAPCKIEVGMLDGIRGIIGKEAVTMFIGRWQGGRQYMTIGRVYMTAKEAHNLATELETYARSVAGKFGG